MFAGTDQPGSASQRAHQCELLELCRGSYYYQCSPEMDENLALMRRLPAQVLLLADRCMAGPPLARWRRRRVPEWAATIGIAMSVWTPAICRMAK